MLATKAGARIGGSRGLDPPEAPCMQALVQRRGPHRKYLMRRRHPANAISPGAQEATPPAPEVQRRSRFPLGAQLAMPEGPAGS